MAKQIDINELWPLLERHTEHIPKAVRSGVERWLLDAVRFVTKAKLRFSKDRPPVPTGLRWQTGTAVRSVRWDLEHSASRVVGRFGSPLGYVRAHEEGFRGTVQVPAHTRRVAPLERNARGKVTAASAKRYKQAKAKGRKTTVQVRAHSRRVNMHARRFFYATLKAIGPKLPIYARKSLDVLARHARVPSPGEL